MTATYAAHARAYAERESRLREIRELAHLLDSAFRIPGINFRFGVDAVVGLIPVVGDLAGFAVSTYIIARAAQLGAPVGLIARMVINAVIEAVVGSIPLLGSIFDVIWKANMRNLRLLERFLATGA